MLKKVGILVPMYNSENTISRCVKSIINQTYTELEVIIIDDGSKDNSLEICKNAIKNDNRFKLVTRENKGVAFTRNELIQKCTSEHFVFVDSDDFIDENYIEVLEGIIEKNDVSMVASQIYLNYKGKNKKTDNFKTIIIDNKQGLKKLLYNHELQHGPTCKMYKKELFNNIEFPNGEIYEDLAIMYKIIDKCQNIALTEYQGYNYTFNNNGITKSGFSDIEISMLKYGEEIFEYVTQKYGDELMLPAENVLIDQSIELACKIPLNKKYINEIIKIKKNIKKYRMDLLKSNETYPRIKAFLIASFLGIRGIKILNFLCG